MENYFMFIVVAAFTIASPGPGVIMTINNSIQRRTSNTLSGIMGIVTGMLIVSILSASSLGVILASSAIAFTVVKFVGAAYLIYLGVKMWRAKATLNATAELKSKSNTSCYKEGLFLTISNPKPIFFFMSLFPQFINSEGSYIQQFIILSLTFSLLVFIIHSIYALLASMVKEQLSKPKGVTVLNKVSGSIFMCFGMGLAASSK